MNGPAGLARRYHWHSDEIRSFLEEPHTSIVGENLGKILNLTDKKAAKTKQGILDITKERPGKMVDEIRQMVLPSHHEVTYRDVDLKRLGAVLAVAYDRKFMDFEELLLLEGLGPKTLRSLTLISEVIHGTPSRFDDPARYSFACGGKDGKPFPVQTEVYDETLQYLRRAVDKAKLGFHDRKRAIRRLVPLVERIEKDFRPDKDRFDKFIMKEIKESPSYGGRTVSGSIRIRPGSRKRKTGPADRQLTLFSLENIA
jgi:hypothetical protein